MIVRRRAEKRQRIPPTPVKTARSGPVASMNRRENVVQIHHGGIRCAFPPYTLLEKVLRR